MASHVKHGETGIITQAKHEWLPALESLAADPKGAAALGHAARQDLEKNWACSSGAGSGQIISPEVVKWVTA